MWQVVLLIGLSAVACVGLAMHGVPPSPWQFSARPSATDLSCFLGIALFAFGMQAAAHRREEHKHVLMVQ